MRLFRKESPVLEPNALPSVLLEALGQLDQNALVLAPGEVIVFASENIDHIGILRDGLIQSQELLAIIRVVRRTNIRQTGTIEVPRGPIGEGRHELTVNVIPLIKEQLVLVLLSDESQAQRIQDVRRDFVANVSQE